MSLYHYIFVLIVHFFAFRIQVTLIFGVSLHYILFLNFLFVRLLLIIFIGIYHITHTLLFLTSKFTYFSYSQSLRLYSLYSDISKQDLHTALDAHTESSPYFIESALHCPHSFSRSISHNISLFHDIFSP